MACSQFTTSANLINRNSRQWEEIQFVVHSLHVDMTASTGWTCKSPWITSWKSQINNISFPLSFQESWILTAIKINCSLTWTFFVLKFGSYFSLSNNKIFSNVHFKATYPSFIDRMIFVIAHLLVYGRSNWNESF